MNADQPVSSGNTVLNKTETLVSTLVKPTETTDSVKISLNDLEIQVFAVGPRAFLKENPMLSINNTQMDIDLIGISQNNNGSAAVAFMSYTNMVDMLSPKLFNPNKKTVKIMMSTVVSATLPKTINTQLPTPVNFTIKHINELPPNSTLFCVYWNHSEWIVDGCYLLQTNISHSVCSCFHLSTFALIMQLNPPTGDDSDPVMDLINIIAVAVGLLFLSLTLLTFAICRRNPRVTNTALTNLCISLLLAHLLFLLTQIFLQYIQPQHLLCAVLAGVLHFLFLSAFVWMFIQAVLLFISVKNLTKIRSKQKEVLSWKFLIVIGYVIPLIIVGVSVGLFSDGYGSEQCWLKTDNGFLWSFLGPVCAILAANMILFVSILVIIISTLKSMKSEITKIKKAKNEQHLVKSVILKTMVQFYIVGSSWILGFFTDYNKMLKVVFLFFNSQQGTFIFFIHCAFNQEVRQLYKKWWQALSAACRPHTKKKWIIQH
ncbi:adhesion G protein-coupled receptor E3-like [Colossoma macropomum]|uniref:adhesion G protein-coupled receptor E3-like n=1 Tax=Colossoma macropomum TaxID=42526 RepID=UPI0018649837|nr:adhesion G protein-coupled receptor E3-like [Colossoma macropomum]